MISSRRVGRVPLPWVELATVDGGKGEAGAGAEKSRLSTGLALGMGWPVAVTGTIRGWRGGVLVNLESSRTT